MKGILDFAARTPVLIASFIGVLVCMAGFQHMKPMIGPLLDFAISGAAAAQALSAMSPAQKQAHLLMTAFIDTPYPIFYGALFAGLTARFATRRRLRLASPMLIGVGLDYIENGAQIAALSGWPAALAIKSFVTPAKFTLVLAGIAIALFLIVAALVRRVSAPRDAHSTDTF